MPRSLPFTFANRAALFLAPLLAGVSGASAQTTLTLDTFNAGQATGTVISSPIPSTWVGNVVQNATSITIGGTARDDNGWGASGLSLNASAMSYVRITGQRDAGNAAQTLSVQLFDTNLNSVFFSVNTSAFTAGSTSQVQIPITGWDSGFNPAQITSWNIGGGTTGLVSFRLTLDHLGLADSLISPGAGGTIVTAGNQVYTTPVTLAAATTLGNTGSNGSAITFNTSIDGTHALALHTTGATTLNAAVGNVTPLASLTTDTGGTTSVTGGKVFTTGAQTYHDTVSLGADAHLKSTAGGITFVATLAGNGHNLVIEVAQATSFVGANDLASLTKAGSGTMTLTGQSTYTGPTIVSGGTIALRMNNALAATSALVLSGGHFATGGFSQTLGALTLSGNSNLDFGSGASALAFADSHLQTWTGSLSVINFTTGVDSLRFGTSSTALTLAQLVRIDFGPGIAAQIDANGFVMAASAIPEPSSYAVFVAGTLLGVTLWRRRRGRPIVGTRDL